MKKELSKSPKNITFVQWEKSSMNAFRDLVSASPAAAQILTLITEKMDLVNSLIISQQTMADLCNVSRPTVARAIKILKERNWIDTVRVGSSTAYICNSVFWQQGRDKKFYADFTSRVIASAAEQNESIEELQKPKNLNKIPTQKGAENITISDDESPPTQDELELHNG